MTETQKAKFLLERGDHIQKSSVLSTLKHILSSEHNHGFLKFVLDHVPRYEEDLLLSLARGLQESLSLIPGDFLVPILTVAEDVLKTDSEVLVDDWGKVIETVLKLTQLTESIEVGVPLVFSLCSSSRPNFTRKVGAVLLGVLAEVLGRYFPIDLLHRATELSQDVSYEMRKLMCNVMDKISTELGNGEQIFTSVKELVNDDDSRVRLEAIGVFLNIFPTLSEDGAKKALKLLQDILQIETQDFRLKVVKKMGPLLSAVYSFPDTAYYGEVLLNIYMEALNGTPDSKKSALSAYPEVARAVDPAIFDTKLVYSYLTLCTDIDQGVRTSVASIFHQVAPMMASSVSIVSKVKMNLLKDPELQWLMFDHVDGWAHELLDEHTMSLIKDLLLSKKPWRSKLLLLDRISKFTVLQLSPTLCEHIAPALITLMHDGCAALRSSSVKIFVKLLSVTYHTSEREDFFNKMTSEFAESNISLDRITYIQFCVQAISTFSARLIKKFFFRSLLVMSNDPVLPVRMTFANDLTLIYAGIPKDDAESLDQLYSSVSVLCNDENGLVSAAAADAQITLSTSAYRDETIGELQIEEETRRIELEDGWRKYELVSQEEAKQLIVNAMNGKGRRNSSKKLSQPNPIDSKRDMKRSSVHISKTAIGPTKPRSSYSFNEGRTTDSPPRSRLVSDMRKRR